MPRVSQSQWCRQDLTTAMLCWIEHCKIQRVQNTLARVVTSTRRRDNITPVLADLHWLPTTARIEYMIALLTCKTLTTQQLSYLYELLHLYRPARQLCSTEHNRLDDRVVKTIFASRAFSHAAPSVWNNLPTDLTDELSSITVFKWHLKIVLLLITLLFPHLRFIAE